MNRRSFLHIFGAGLPAVVVAEKFGLIERVRSYFFAPKGGWWTPSVNLSGTALTREMVQKVFEQMRYRSLEGLPYWADNWTGTFYGISRASYPKVDFDKALLIGNA